MLVSSTCITVTNITETVMAHLCGEPAGALLTASSGRACAGASLATRVDPHNGS
jgi:hypothetical protein